MASDEQLRSQANPVFRFVVSIDNQKQAAFTECTLPVIEWETEEVKEGGLNTYTHLLPGRRKAARITLKNGVAKSDLVQWYIQTLGETFTMKPITVELLDARKNKVMGWHVKNAYPVKWTGPQLKPSESTIAVQTLEFACGEITVDV